MCGDFGRGRLERGAELQQFYNPYDYTQSALATCGVAVSSNAVVATMTGGGTTYSYAMPNGAGVSKIVVSPAGFDPVDATPQQLAEYDLPARPSLDDLQAMMNWQAYVSQLKDPVAAPPFLVVSTSSNGNVSNNQGTSQNWSGYLADASGTTYTSALTDWTEPSYAGSQCSSNANSNWAGIGGWNGNPDLGQDGVQYTYNDNTQVAPYQAWYQVLPALSGSVPLNLYVFAGQEAGAITNYSNGTYSGDVVNVTTGKYQPWSYSGPLNGATADFIAERPTIGNSYSNLSAFGTMSFSSPEANYTDLNSLNAANQRTGLEMEEQWR